MRFPSIGAYPATLLITLSVLGGCSSIGTSINPAKYDGMSCTELNSALGDNARAISQTAVTRGKVANTNVPRWVPGGSRVKGAVAARETTRIERLKQQQDAIIAARSHKCPGSAG
ncbi:hypothetical protein [Mesorhizobium sp. ES1-1]|uniref:hypothetical protein n=1 Tax=Mesorhizobium sp. ES1-1 TaxID=2876629 RepID=UPI001CCD12A5|nr:hypothetical protein [Mesorhizobium sp. ES1-1]MBZ9674768.1 hypothetical protein [Mesorhizobium sp. ES1-1]